MLTFLLIFFKWYDSIVFLRATVSRNASETPAKTDGSGPLVGGEDTRIICKNLGLEGILGCLFGSPPVLQWRKCLRIYCVHFCLLKRPQTCFKSRAKLWVSVLSRSSLNSSNRQKRVTGLTAVSHAEKETSVRVKEREHLGGGECDESQSQLVAAYATLNNAPFQMVNLVNPRLPLAPHWCQKSPWQRTQGLIAGCDDWGGDHNNQRCCLWEAPNVSVL